MKIFWISWLILSIIFCKLQVCIIYIAGMIVKLINFFIASLRSCCQAFRTSEKYERPGFGQVANVYMYKESSIYLAQWQEIVSVK